MKNDKQNWKTLGEVTTGILGETLWEIYEEIFGNFVVKCFEKLTVNR